MIATPKGDGDRLEVNGSFLRIYQRQANGEWRMTRDMFNSSTPLTQTCRRAVAAQPLASALRHACSSRFADTERAVPSC